MRKNLMKIGFPLILIFLFCANLSLLNAQRDFSLIELKKPEIPVVYFKVMIKSGSADDPKGKEGLAYFTANLLKRGTISFSRDSLDQTLDFISANIDINVQKDVICISGTTLKENLDKFYPLFMEVILNPNFSEEEIGKMKKDQVGAIERVKQNDAELSLECLNNFIYQGHPYGHLTEGRVSAINSFTREDAVNFYNAHFSKNNIIAGIAGDFDEKLLERFRNDLNKLKDGVIIRQKREVHSIVGRKVLLVEKEGREQTQLRFGHPYNLTRKEKDFLPLLVLNTYLGKHRESFGRLYRTVREKRGLSYGAYSYVEHFEQAGWSNMQKANIPRGEQYFSMWTYPKAVNGKFTIKLVLSELSNLVTNGISQKDLDRVKNFEKNHFPFEIETPQRKSGLMMDEEFYGTKGFLENFEKNIDKITADEINSSAKKYLSPDNIAIVCIVSDGEKFKEELLSEKTEIEYPSGTDALVLKKEDEEVKGLDLKLKPEDIQIWKVSELFR